MDHFRIASSALGYRVTAYVTVHDTSTELRQYGEAFSCEMFGADTHGLTQAIWDAEERATCIVIRLSRENLTHAIASHEASHAAHAHYGAMLHDSALARDHLTHYNEPLAHLASDFYSAILANL